MGNQDSKLPMKGCNNSTKMSSEGKQATVCLRADWENLLTQATFHRDHYEKNLYTMGKIQKPVFCNLHLREHRIQSRTLRMRRWPFAWQLIWPPKKPWRLVAASIQPQNLQRPQVRVKEFV